MKPVLAASLPDHGCPDTFRRYLVNIPALRVLFVSTLGFLPEELDYVFEPLATPDPMERAQILASYAGTVGIPAVPY